MKRISQEKGNPPLRFRRIFLFCGVFMLASEIWKQLTLTFQVNGGEYLWFYFPFQLCSTPMYILLALPFIRRSAPRRALLTYLMTFGLLGGVIVLADTSGLHYPIPALTVHSFAWHAALAGIGVLAGAALERPSFSDLKNAVLLYAAFCSVAFVLNAAFDRFGEINLFYINPTRPMEQVVFRDLVPVLGKNAVLCLYVFMTVVGASLLWAFWYALHTLLGRRRASERSTDRR